MAAKIEEIGFGDEVSDIVTGFTGIVTAKALYSTGCNQVYVSAPVDNDGKYVDGRWFDIERMQIEQPGKVCIATSPSGGPRGSESAPSC